MLYRPSGHRAFRHSREPKALDPVAGIGVKRFLHGPTQPQAAQRGVNALEVPLDHRSALRACKVGTQAGRSGQPRYEGPGQKACCECSCLVRVGGDAVRELVGMPARIGEIAPTRSARSLRIATVAHATLRSDSGAAARALTACGVGCWCGEARFE